MRERLLKKKILLISLFFITMTTGLLVVRIYQNHMSQNIFPANLSSSLTFPLFYPTALPPGFSLDRRSVQQTNGQVVTYSANDKLGHNIVFSIQQRPATFDFDSFYSKSLTSTQRFTTANGEAAIGSTALAGKVGSLVSGDAWVLVTSNQSDTSSEVFQNILKSLTPVR